MAATLQERAAAPSVVRVAGPRPSGKTTVCRPSFGDLPYANLERADTRDFAREDPRDFLTRFADGGVIDVVQRVPELLLWTQVLVDAPHPRGPRVLTDSHQARWPRVTSRSSAASCAWLRVGPLLNAHSLAVDAGVAATLGPERIGRRRLIHGGGERLVRRGVEFVGVAA